MNRVRALCLFFLAAPALVAQPVTSIRPASGFTTGGDLVHIRGFGLRGGSPACPGASCPNYVKFGDTFARIVLNTPFEIVAIAPPHGPGAVDVTVGIPGVSSPDVIANAYRYETMNDIERILIPIARSGPGPNTARFETQISITNVGEEDIGIGGAAATPSLAPLTPGPIVHPHTTRMFTDALRDIPGHAGAFINVLAVQARDVITKVRVHDTSRDAAAFGVEIPTVSDLDFAKTIRLTGIPTDARFRSTLRVYAYDATNFGPVTVRVRDDADGTLLATVPVALDRGELGREADIPASAQISLDPIIEPLRNHSRIRLDIADSDTIRPIWAFVSITNNQTQEITLVTPPRSGPAASPDKLPLGWYIDTGRDLVDVEETGAKVYVLCTRGQFKIPASLDSNGSFKTTGTLSGGPGPEQDGGATLDFEGRVVDGWLMLTIRPSPDIVTTYHLMYVGAQQPESIPIQCP
jgi:hypothetical protein